MTDFFQWTMDWAAKNKIDLKSFAEVSSTNTIAKSDSEFIVKNGEMLPLRIYAARNQTHGRGRGSNQWVAEMDTAFTSSWSITLDQSPQPVLSPLLGLALYEALVQTWPDVPFSLKAPNDLYISDKKLAGILIESMETIDSAQKKKVRVVIGIGLNVLNHPQELTTATHLVAHLNEKLIPVDWHSFLDSWFSNFKSAIHEGVSTHLLETSAQRLQVALNRHPLKAEPILRVDELGQLHTKSKIIKWHEL